MPATTVGNNIIAANLCYEEGTIVFGNDVTALDRM